MLRTKDIDEDGCDVVDEKSQAVILTVWRANKEPNYLLLARAGNIAKCINDEMRNKRK